MKQALKAVFATLSAWGPWGVLLLAALDGAGIPVPEGVDFLMIVTAASNPVAGYFSAVLGVIGSLGGSVFLYYLGRKGGEAYLDKRSQTGWGRRFRRWFHHYGGLTVFIPALLPIPLPLKIFVLSAGALGMKRARFLAIMLAARVPRYFGLAYLGTQLGTEPWRYIKGHMLELIAIAVALFLFLVLLVKLTDRLRRRAP